MKTRSIIRATLVGATLACGVMAAASSVEAMPAASPTLGQTAGKPLVEKVVVIVTKRVVRRPPPRVIVKKTIIR